VACTKYILLSSNDASRIVTNDSKVMLLIVTSLTDDYRGITYNPRGVINTHKQC
jgi:hypothetical protein